MCMRAASAQTELFDEAKIEGCDSDQKFFAEAAPVPSASTAKAGRKPIPQDFPRIFVEHDLTNAEKLCSCGCEKQHIGDEVSE
jgi:transposase